MKNESQTTVAAMLADGSLYEAAPEHLRTRLQARLRAAALTSAHAPASAIDETIDDIDDIDDMQRSSIDAHPTTSGADTGARFRRDPARVGSWYPQRTRSGVFFGGVALGVALSVMTGVTLLRGGIIPRTMQSNVPQLEQEIVSSHVRALLSLRTMDVLSTDQHTVKPWFNGRINYAPPVVDTRNDGFPLVGGRLDYVGARPVAVMVYRYLKHPIDLYVFPDNDDAANTSLETTSASRQKEDAMARLETMTQQGYSLVEWHQHGMIYWAITDASMANLTLFANAVKRATLR